MMRGSLALVAIAACAAPTSTEDDAIARKAPSADVDLDGCDGRVFQSADTTWSLTKTGSIDAATRTVTWTVNATASTTATNHLVLAGSLRIRNTGDAPATIGNIIVNLQEKNHGWHTRASDIADATSGEAATTAHAQDDDYAEGAASGSLLFMDEHNNSAFSLVPEVSVPPHHTIRLYYAATFDNSVLQLAHGTKIRSEVLLTFGNHSSHGNVGDDIDINGNGTIDADEAHVRTVSDREELRVPWPSTGNTHATLTDTAADITTTGTVTFDSAHFNLGATSGTITAHVDGGTAGGNITNCAHLVTSGGQHLEACNTLSVGANACVDGHSGCGWKDGDVVTYNQAAWSALPQAATALQNNFATVYASTFGVLELGLPGAAGFSALFSSADAILHYVPTTGAPAPLDTDLNNPVTTSAGVFGGDVLALQLDIDFGDAGVLAGAAPVRFGDLHICGLTGATAGLNGSTVRSFATVANTALGGGATGYTVADLDAVTDELAAAFNDGTVTTFAQDHLVDGACP
jgi:hypothetical protein